MLVIIFPHLLHSNILTCHQYKPLEDLTQYGPSVWQLFYVAPIYLRCLRLLVLCWQCPKFLQSRVGCSTVSSSATQTSQPDWRGKHRKRKSLWRDTGSSGAYWFSHTAPRWTKGHRWPKSYL